MTDTIDTSKIQHLTIQNENKLVHTLAGTHRVPVRTIYENLEESGANFIASLISPSAKIGVVGIETKGGYPTYTGLYLDQFIKETKEKYMDPSKTDIYLYPCDDNISLEPEACKKFEEYLIGASLIVPCSIIHTELTDMVGNPSEMGMDHFSRKFTENYFGEDISRRIRLVPANLGSKVDCSSWTIF